MQGSHESLRAGRLGLLAAGVALVMAAGLRPETLRAQGRAEPAVVDVSGVERFLEITALLERDSEPAPAQWDSLFGTPGYTVLLRREFRRDFFIRRFELAFMPSKRADLEEQRRRDTGFYAQFLPHYLRAKSMREEIRRRMEELRTADFSRDALARARAFLPNPLPDGAPSVAFVIFAPDARGYDPVVVDILLARGREEFLNLVAHEFHHWYRARLAPDLTRHQQTLRTIEQIQLEGIADLINVPSRLDTAADTLSSYDRQYLDYLRNSPATIRVVDSLLAAMLRNPSGARDLGERLRAAVPLSGHPTGYYMARTILEEVGREALVSTVSNPFAFFRLYSQAASRRRDGTPPLSARALEFLRQLESQYARPM